MTKNNFRYQKNENSSLYFIDKGGGYILLHNTIPSNIDLKRFTYN